MKIRAGFVSNSSTTSFMVVGKYLGRDEYVAKLKDISEAQLSLFVETSEWNELFWGSYTDLDSIFEYSSDVLVGIDYDGHGDLDEMISGRDNIASVLKVDPKSLGVHSWSYYNG